MLSVESNWTVFERTRDKTLCTRRAARDLAKVSCKLEIRIKAAFYCPIEAWVMLAPSWNKPEEREFVVDSEESMHMLSIKDLSSDELETLRRSRNPTTVVTTTGEVQTSEEAQENVYDFDLFVTVQLLEDTLAVLSLGKLCEEHGYSCEWVSGQKPRLTKQGKNILCKTEDIVPLVVPGLSSNSGTRSSSTSLPQDSSSTSSSPATERSDDGAPENWRDTPKTQYKRKRDNDFETFRNGHRSSHKISKIQRCLHPRTFPMTQIRNGLQKWHPRSTDFLTHFPKVRNCEVCLRTEMTRASCRRRIGEALPQAEKFGDLITTDHKVLIEEGESRNNHRYAVVVQDLVTQ